MASVSVTINGRRYEIACDEGQEAQLSRLGRYVDDRVRQLAAAVGQLGDTRLMVMTSLLLADELSDKNDELEAYKVENNAVVRDRKEELLVERLDRLTQRLVKMAEKIEDEPELIQEAPPEPEEPVVDPE